MFPRRCIIFLSVSYLCVFFKLYFSWKMYVTNFVAKCIPLILGTVFLFTKIFFLSSEFSWKNITKITVRRIKWMLPLFARVPWPVFNERAKITRQHNVYLSYNHRLKLFASNGLALWLSTLNSFCRYTCKIEGHNIFAIFETGWKIKKRLVFWKIWSYLIAKFYFPNILCDMVL